ncbi:hypothetical protein RUND412_007818, partial [Rhizina undulata]
SKPKQEIKAVGFNSSNARASYIKDISPPNQGGDHRPPGEVHCAVSAEHALHGPSIKIQKLENQFYNAVIEEIGRARYANITEEMYPKIRNVFMYKIERKKNGKCGRYKSSRF